MVAAPAVADGIATVMLNRPHYRNAFGRITTYEVDRAFSAACEDDSVGAIILCGAGEHFCSGHDLGTPEQLADIEASPYQPGVRGEMKKWRATDSEMCLKWRSLPKPTICAVQVCCCVQPIAVYSHAAADRFNPTERRTMCTIVTMATGLLHLSWMCRCIFV